MQDYQNEQWVQGGFAAIASYNVCVIHRERPDLLIGLANGGILSALATERAWTVLTGETCPPLLLTNLGREKLVRYNTLHSGRKRGRFQGEPSGYSEVIAFLDWLGTQHDWLDTLRSQVEQTLGHSNPPRTIVVIDESCALMSTLLLTLGLLESLYPQAQTFFLDGPHFDWREVMPRAWLATFHPHILQTIQTERESKIYEASGALYDIASGTEDIADDSLEFRPLSPDNPSFEYLRPHLPTEVWLTMPSWISQRILHYVEKEAASTTLAMAQEEYAQQLAIEGNGAAPYLLLRHIRRWGSITVKEASSYLGISEAAASEKLKWLRLITEYQWTGQPPLTDARTSAGRTYFTYIAERDLPEPPVRRNKQQKAKEDIQRKMQRKLR